MPTSRKLTTTDNPAAANANHITEDAPPAPQSKSNTQLLIGMLASDTGATIAQITEATGWLPHSARAALSGLRKKGHTIARTSADGIATYRIVEPAQ